MDHLSGDSILKLAQSFGFLARTLDFQAASAGVCWTSPVYVVTRDGPRSKQKVWAVSVHSPVKDVVYPSIQQLAECSAESLVLVRINYVTKNFKF